MTTYNDLRWDSIVGVGQAARHSEELGRDAAPLTVESLQALLTDYEVATQAFEAASRALVDHSVGGGTDAFGQLLEAEERAHDAVVLARTRIFVRRCELQVATETHAATQTHA